MRERNAPAGAPWRLVAALDGPAVAFPAPMQWLDLEVARRRLAAADRNLAHDQMLFRQPLTTLDDHLARGLRVEALHDVLDAFVTRDA